MSLIVSHTNHLGDSGMKGSPKSCITQGIAPATCENIITSPIGSTPIIVWAHCLCILGINCLASTMNPPNLTNFSSQEIQSTFSSQEIRIMEWSSSFYRVSCNLFSLVLIKSASVSHKELCSTQHKQDNEKALHIKPSSSQVSNRLHR